MLSEKVNLHVEQERKVQCSAIRSDRDFAATWKGLLAAVSPDPNTTTI